MPLRQVQYVRVGVGRGQNLLGWMSIGSRCNSSGLRKSPRTICSGPLFCHRLFRCAGRRRLNLGGEEEQRGVMVLQQRFGSDPAAPFGSDHACLADEGGDRQT